MATNIIKTTDWNPHTLLLGTYNGLGTLENGLAVFKKVKTIHSLKESYVAQNSLELKTPLQVLPTILCKQRTLLPKEKNGH